jgi:hypothetical protein
LGTFCFKVSLFCTRTFCFYVLVIIVSKIILNSNKNNKEERRGRFERPRAVHRAALQP